MSTPSPCLDVCKYKLRGHCIACGMTKMQKKLSERPMAPAERAEALRALLAQQAALGPRFLGFRQGYRAKCRRMGVPCPLDLLEEEEG